MRWANRRGSGRSVCSFARWVRFSFAVSCVGCFIGGFWPGMCKWRLRGGPKRCFQRAACHLMGVWRCRVWFFDLCHLWLGTIDLERDNRTRLDQSRSSLGRLHSPSRRQAWSKAFGANMSVIARFLAKQSWLWLTPLLALWLCSRSFWHAG